MAFAVSTRLSTRSVAPKRMIASKASSINNIHYLKSLPGVTAPFSEVFDPANLSATASVKDIRRWRESELVHGRVAMLAAVGFVVQENIQDNQLFFPFAGKITGPAIYHFQQIQQGFWEPLLLVIGIAEAYRVAVGWTPPVNGVKFNALREDYDMGDLGFDPLGLKPKDAEGFKDMQTKELNNGRLAMLAVAGFVTQELLFQHETLTWGGFNQALEQHPIDPSDIKRPPLPVEFPDRGLPNVKDIKLLSLPSVNSLPSINVPDAIKNFQPPSLTTLANNTPDMPNVNALPKPSLPSLSGLKASAQDLASKLPDIPKPTVSVPGVSTPGRSY